MSTLRELTYHYWAQSQWVRRVRKAPQPLVLLHLQAMCPPNSKLFQVVMTLQHEATKLQAEAS